MILIPTIQCLCYRLRQGNIFTPVCHSVHRGRGLPYCMLGYTSRLGRQPPGQTPCRQTASPSTDTPMGRHPLGRHPLARQLLDRHIPLGRHIPMGRHLLGRHPTGRHPSRQTPPPDTTGWAVNILLECILVSLMWTWRIFDLLTLRYSFPALYWPAVFTLQGGK